MLNIHPYWNEYSKDRRNTNITYTVFSNHLVGGSLNIILIVICHCKIKQISNYFSSRIRNVFVEQKCSYKRSLSKSPIVLNLNWKHRWEIKKYFFLPLPDLVGQEAPSWGLTFTTTKTQRHPRARISTSGCWPSCTRFWPEEPTPPSIMWC